ncbi:MAG: hypothetical protein DMF78_15440 [Acidobacteria bacterium]|nr:MAG: hypothetical protein DMF78_15440 [Acidobacteriota bacterium]
MNDGATEPLAILGGLLDGLRAALDEFDIARLEAEVREYVERAVEAAVAAAARTRHDKLATEADAQVRETAAAARALLEELRGSVARAQSILERSRRLRRHAVELSAAALLLRRQSDHLTRRTSGPDHVRLDLRGVRVLVVEGHTGTVPGLSTSLSVLGTEASSRRRSRSRRRRTPTPTARRAPPGSTKCSRGRSRPPSSRRPSPPCCANSPAPV